MKKYLLLLFFNCVLPFIAYSQNENCGASLNCDPATKYPYRNCDGKPVCTNNPLLLTPKVPTVDVPICLEHIPKDGPPADIYLPTTSPTGGYKVFTMSEVVNDIKCAKDQWACVCGKQNAPCKCTVKLVWSINPKIWSNPKSELGAARSRYSEKNCWLSCKEHNQSDDNTSSIRLNNCPEFVDAEPNGTTPRNVLVNSGVDYANSGPTSKCETFNLCDLLSHEIGHLYGLQHYDINNGVIANCNSTPETTNGQMNSEREPGLPKQGLKKDDKCAFARLYCNAVHVEDSDSLFSEVRIKTYPTPTQSLLNIEFSIDRNTVYLIFQVFSESGKLVYDNGYFYNNQGLNRITEDFSFLTNGTYYFKIYSEINVFSGKFVIAK